MSKINSSDGKEGAIICLLIVAFIVFIPYFFFELHYYNQKEAVSYIVQNVRTQIPQGDKGIEFLNKNSAQFQGKIVFLQGISIESKIYDQEFEFEFENVGELERSVQYCQWVESVDYSSSSNSNSNYGEQKQYSYSIQWRSYLEPSYFFYDSYRHYNPQRNPVSKFDIFSNAKLGDGKQNILLNCELIDDMPGLEVEQYYLPNNVHYSDFAKQNGFSSVSSDKTWFISYYNGYNNYGGYGGGYHFNKKLKKQGNYTEDGEIQAYQNQQLNEQQNKQDEQINTKIQKKQYQDNNDNNLRKQHNYYSPYNNNNNNNNYYNNGYNWYSDRCNPGDIRVKWNKSQLPNKISIIGILDKNQIIEIEVENGNKVLLAVDGVQTLKQIEEQYNQQYDHRRNIMRWIFYIIFIIIAGLMGFVFFSD
ncbi:hypothetical protein PPERSA_10424 [Pseudocohnilembus persalinus]|uniref:Transmembrane protein n=1 Tax=Pseudocohnilembus persalinus TaxID=266149 RepID=A0A0V0QWI1_PSEPJ|nr:hypothetical protein PPERSA_10424 [Pseudocohnilembus persalinus]|eukprot:KRX06566.1 hypothetical protein PPERSA_10424 [Pseudocohnilembus persalinus]